MEARHKSGRVLEVIRSENFRMPRNDLEMLVQSHTEGEPGESVEGVDGIVDGREDTFRPPQELLHVPT